MKENKFIDTYSDDILYLYHMREASLSHPLKYTNPLLFSASFTRIYCVFMIGSIEAMLKQWSDIQGNEYLGDFLDNKKCNRSRVDNLRRSFELNDIPVDKEVLEDYLAIKYIRNIIVHSEQSNSQLNRREEFILKRHFPIDPRELNDTHLKKMHNVNENMMMYIGLTSLIRGGKSKSFKKGSLLRIDHEVPSVDDIIYSSQIPKVIYNNISKILMRFEQIFEQEESEKQDELFYLSNETLLFWNEFKRHRFNERLSNKFSLESSLDILKSLLENGNFMKYPIEPNQIKKLYDRVKDNEISENQILVFFNGKLNYPLKDIIESLLIGESAYHSIPNITLFKLFTCYLPRFLPNEKEYLVSEAKDFLLLFKLSRYYYNYFEKHSDITELKKVIQSYEGIIDKM